MPIYEFKCLKCTFVILDKSRTSVSDAIRDPGVKSKFVVVILFVNHLPTTLSWIPVSGKPEPRMTNLFLKI